MSIGAINQSTQSVGSPATKSKADESIEQLAADGDPVAIAELKEEELQQTPLTGASEPGKGQQVDKFV